MKKHKKLEEIIDSHLNRVERSAKSEFEYLKGLRDDEVSVTVEIYRIHKSLFDGYDSQLSILRRISREWEVRKRVDL